MSEHFVDRLSEALQVGGIETVRLTSRDGEVGNNAVTKAGAFLAHVSNVRRHVRSAEPNVVAWPLLGWWEIPLWRHPYHRTYVVMHDPEPLVPQGGLSPRAAVRAAALSGSRWPRLVTLSPEAYAVAAKYFPPEQINLAPHPMRSPDAPTATASNRVLVLGQFKPARDLEIMAAIAPALRARGWEPTVAGRGWPAIPGWQVIDRFLTEGEFERLLISSATVLLPYRYYFQSGVALRALEAGVPVVGRATGFLRMLLGDSFPGVVDVWEDPACWLAAVHEAASSRDIQLRSATAYSVQATTDWCALLDRQE